MAVAARHPTQFHGGCQPDNAPLTGTTHSPGLRRSPKSLLQESRGFAGSRQAVIHPGSFTGPAAGTGGAVGFPGGPETGLDPLAGHKPPVRVPPFQPLSAREKFKLAIIENRSCLSKGVAWSTLCPGAFRLGNHPGKRTAAGGGTRTARKTPTGPRWPVETARPSHVPSVHDDAPWEIQGLEARAPRAGATPNGKLASKI